MEKKKQSILFYAEDLQRLKELQAYYNKSSLNEVSYGDVVRQALKLVHGSLDAKGLINKDR